MRYLRLGVALAALAVPAALIPAAVQAQETSSAIRGAVVNEQGAAIAGATVTIIHTPSGTRLSQTSGANGEFNATGLRLGGPYSITVEAPGFDAATETLDNLTAGVPQRIDVFLAATGKTITVSAARTRSAIVIGTGAASILTARDIAGVANVNRDIRNLAARDPMVNIDPTNGGAISIAGQNNRFNRFTVDGVAFGDPFGLEAGGLVSTRGPVPLDAIGEFSVEVAPVDIRQGFFQGGAINTQLKSGSNRFTFLAGAYYNDDSLRGRNARGVIRAGAFESQVYTAQFTGPIIKDRLFFALTYERTRDTVPAAISPASLGITDGQISQIGTIAQNRYGFDTGGVATDILEKDDKVVAKFDLNIADGHRAAFTYIYNEGSVLAGQTGVGELNATNPTFALLSNNYNQGAVNHFGIFELNDQWSDNFSTQVRVSYADYVRLQVPFSDRAFGQFQTCLEALSTTPPLTCPAGTRRLNFGPDISRQANELSSQQLNFEFQATLKMNNHTLKAIVERRTQDVNNLFAQRVSGAWYFDSLLDLDGRRANEVDFAVPLRGGVDTVRAVFQNNSWSFGIQDTIDLGSDATLIAGMRYDLFDTPDVPFFNQAFVDRFGFPNNATLNGRGLFQPRIGLNWKVSDRMTLRGSAGIFGGGNPNVWISNNYSNPGPTLGRVQVRRVPGVNGAADTFTISGLTGLSAATQNTLGAATLNNVSGGTGVPQSLIDAVRTTGTAGSPTNALDPDYRIPSTWRVSGSLDYLANLGFLGDEWRLGLDVVWSRARDASTWTDLRSVPLGTLPDGRIRYQALPGQGTTTNTDILLTNVDDGYSWNVVTRFDKRWSNGFRLGGSYTFQRSRDANNGTSSVAFSNYTNAAAGIDPNNAAYGISSYQRDDTYRLMASYDFNMFGDNNTRIELFFNSQAGQRYSYTMADQASGNLRSNVFGVTGTNNRYLLYVPNVSSATADPRVVYGTGFDFNGFQNLVQNSELNRYQGGIAPKNIGKTPRYNRLDIAFRQEVPFIFGGKIELSADVENFLNLLNKDWGTIRQVAFPGYGTVVNVTCATAACTQYQFANRTGTTVTAPVQGVNLNGSLWALRLGARVKF
ncbi:TonB-dependent receptor domain-containing protein [Sandarakinorhabdus sp.]|uniref:TonB-dependent receptor n=1 Tax=Sandarakinorhabdus sp. TaxID=1916663 RepID=UPI00286D7C12|nr:TonB-dependent receptor [Sandarakinorhabdus sp.]